MINYIILGLFTVLCLASIITVVTEPFVPKNTGAGRVLRAARIRLREMSRTGFCVTALVLIVLGLVFGNGEMMLLFGALAVLLLTLIVLHPEDFLSIFRHRRKAKKRTRLGFTPELAGEVPAARLAKVLEPLEAETISEEGKE